MKAAINLIIFLIFQVFILCGQRQTLNVIVLSKEDESPLAGAIVHVDSKIFICDEKGQVSVSIDSLNTILRLEMTGYESYSVKAASIKGNVVYLHMKDYLLGTTVISASRFEKPLAESTISMSVIKPNEVGKLNSLSSETLIDRVPGVQIIDGQANIRGGSGYSYGAGSRVLLMMDDLPVLQPDAGVPYWDDLPLENIGQIEIVKGAASALYGSAAMNGIIHFRSAYPSSEPETALNVSSRIYLKPGTHKEWWGSDSTLLFPNESYISFSHKMKRATVDYSLSASYLEKKGFNRNSDSKNGRFHSLFRKRFSDKLIFNLGVNFNKGQSSDFFYWKDNGLYEGENGAFTNTHKTRFTLDPGLTYVSSSLWKHKLISRYFHITNGNDFDQSNQSENAYVEYQTQKEFLPLKLQCIAGTLWTQSWTQAKLYSDTSFVSVNRAVYMQFEKRFWDRLLFNFGSRYEYYGIKGPGKLAGVDIQSHSTDDKLLFRFGGNLRLFQASYLRVSWGQGFRFPTIAEKFIRTSAGGLKIVPNPNLEAEEGTSWEFGMRQGFKIGSFNSWLDVSYFGSRYYDMMEFVLNNQLQFQSKNIGDTRINGFEMETQSHISFGDHTIRMLAGYTFIDPRYLEFDLKGKTLAINEREFAPKAQQNAANSSSDINILKYRSKHLVRLDAEYNYKSFFGGISYQHASNVEAIDWLFQVTLFIKGIREFRDAHPNGYQVFDFRLGYRFKKVEAQLNMANALNEVYTIRPGLMEAPRNLSLRLTYRIN